VDFADLQMYFERLGAIDFAPFFLSIPIKKARSRISGRAVCFCLLFQTTKSKGVNPPNFELYISFRIRSLKENGRSRGLDKIFPEPRKRAGWPIQAGCPAPCGFIARGGCLHHAESLIVIRRTSIIDPHQTNLSEGITSKTAPSPLLWLDDQPAFYGIPMHIS
jgi:hypothetical protein